VLKRFSDEARASTGLRFAGNEALVAYDEVAQIASADGAGVAGAWAAWACGSRLVALGLG